MRRRPITPFGQRLSEEVNAKLRHPAHTVDHWELLAGFEPCGEMRQRYLSRSRGPNLVMFVETCARVALEREKNGELSLLVKDRDG